MYYQKTQWTGSKKQDYNGSRYDSGFEANYAAELDLRMKAKDIKSWERQVKLELNVNGFHVCNYYIDFIVSHNNGDTEYVETKGYMTETWKLKWKLFEALYTKPGNILTVVMQGNKKPPKAKRIK